MTKVLTMITTVCPTNIYLLKVNNGTTRKKCEKCSQLTIKAPERRQRRRSGAFIATSFWCFYCFSRVFIVHFEQVNANWVLLLSQEKDYLEIVKMNHVRLLLGLLGSARRYFACESNETTLS